MGVLQRFERRLGGLVEGAFARVFGGVVEPVEVATALQREAEDRKAIVGQGRVLVPNDFVVELGRSDSQRLTDYDEPLRRELSSMVQEHATKRGWSFVGPVRVHLEQVEDLGTGVFRVRSAVLADGAQPDQRRQRADDHPRQRADQPPRPYLVYTAGATGDSAPAHGSEQVAMLSVPVTRLGRGQDAQVQLHDTGVSRLHAEIRLEGGSAQIVDLQSTNGTTVNGRPVDSAPLHDGDRIRVGTTSLVFHRDDA